MRIQLWIKLRINDTVLRAMLEVIDVASLVNRRNCLHSMLANSLNIENDPTSAVLSAILHRVSAPREESAERVRLTSAKWE